MKDIHPIALIPVSIFAFLGGAWLGRSRKGLSMRPNPEEGPLRDVPLASWGKFVSIMAIAPRSQVTPRYKLGTFAMDTRRLADVGFMVEPRKATVGGETGVWVGKWKRPLTTDKFLGSMPAQYEAFKRSMIKMAPAVSGFVGKEINGVKCTLSGLLGAGHLAGEKGIQGWVEDPAVRARFKATTANFTKTNGIF